MTDPLRAYVQHKDNCGLWMTLDDRSRMIVPKAAELPQYACTCGLEAALAAEPPPAAGPDRWTCPRDGDFCFRAHTIATADDLARLEAEREP